MGVFALSILAYWVSAMAVEFVWLNRFSEPANLAIPYFVSAACSMIPWGVHMSAGARTKIQVILAIASALLVIAVVMLPAFPEFAQSHLLTRGLVATVAGGIVGFVVAYVTSSKYRAFQAHHGRK